MLERVIYRVTYKWHILERVVDGKLRMATQGIFKKAADEILAMLR